MNKETKNQCQHWTEEQLNELIKLLQKSKELFNRALCIWKIDPVDFEWTDDSETIGSRSYLVPKVHKEMIKNRSKFWL